MFFICLRRPQTTTLFPYTTLFRSDEDEPGEQNGAADDDDGGRSSRRKLPNIADELKRGQTKIVRSEEHTSELQSPDHLVCRLLLEKKKNKQTQIEVTRQTLEQR